MCKFFSFVTVENNRYYFNWQQRQELLKNNPDELNPDSHTSICKFNKLNEDLVNKFEYNPLTGNFAIDQINGKDNHVTSKKWVIKLDFAKVCEPLIIKPIIHPFSLPAPVITERHRKLLKEWNSVRGSVGGSVWNSIGDLVWNSVWDSVGNSVGNSVGAYMSSFFDIKKWKYIKHKSGINPFQSCIDLWEQGLVPSYDGTTLRLHGGPDGKILYETKK